MNLLSSHELADLEPALEFRSVSKTFGGDARAVRALVDVSFQVQVGELIAVMGPSGAGKSTLLTIAGGLEKADSGTVLVGGTDITNLGARQLAAIRLRHVGYVFQDLNLLPALTAVENAAIPLELAGVGRRKAHQQAVAQLEAVGLGERLQHFPDDLSGGEQQRVALARALVIGGTLVLADEPTGALDSARSQVVMQTLRSSCDSGSSAVVVTHDPEVASWADRVLLLRDGALVETGVRR